MKPKKFYSSRLFFFLISIIVAFGSEAMMEYLIEDALQKYNLTQLTIPVAIAIGILTNIALILNFDIFEKIPNVQKLQEDIKREIDSTERLLLALKEEETVIKDIFNRINQRNSILKDFSINLIGTYLKGFSNTSYGIELTGEYWALRTYMEFWDFLVKVQIEKEARGRDCVIARCTHSNDISIWKESDKAYKEFSYDLYRLQREFIKHGGKIVRVFIGEDDAANDDYQEVMKRMEQMGIETKYLSQDETVERSFDFMYMPDEELAMKWITGARGRRLAKCIIEARVDLEVKSAWNSLWDKLIEKGDKIESIPEYREHDKRR
ncbi:MAG: hypothetical protein AAF620_13840 [Bacteroidota bacterium]